MLEHISVVVVVVHRINQRETTTTTSTTTTTKTTRLSRVESCYFGFQAVGRLADYSYALLGLVGERPFGSSYRYLFADYFVCVI